MTDAADNRYKLIEQTMKKLGYDKSALIETLHVAQESFGYLQKDVLKFIAKRLKAPYSKVYGVATFYHHFTLKPQGKHSVIVCLGTACYIKGSKKILESIEERFGVKVGQTTPDGILSLLSARCVGSCSIAPVAIYDNKVKGRLSIEESLEKIEEILR
ncbi:bidirectional hydrogenase complex protein HoxE [Sulfurimonas sp. HSL-1716]|uniref:bidirectional hydrogenase complex protein HoxE n=1 Tax=Hydrocurvibacter sulfurireducens TaxID=3131937 RepID=UPI0031F8B5F8